MNTNLLKRFAQNTRNRLLEAVRNKIKFVLTTDNAELRDYAEAIKKLNEDIQKQGLDAIIDKVTYTWFNRLMALRFMDVNDYQPLGVKIISPKDGFTLPEILDDAKQGHIPAELKVDTAKINDLLDGKIPAVNPQNGVYRILLIAACNHLHTLFPFLFERINDYSELLLPDDLTSELSIIHDFIEGMTDEDCKEVEVIGWLYQFYISEKKDAVFALGSAVKQEDIPAVTQLFTPRWIVEYMVQNTVGKLWLQNHPHSPLKEKMPYYIETESSKSEEYLKISSPEDITMLDQACGSGHILVYGFELLYAIYEESGYNPAEIPNLIIHNNLFGYEIDERAAQLASFAILMKARSYYRRFFKNIPQPHILCYEELRLNDTEIKDVCVKININLSQHLLHDLQCMRQSKNLGSLIRLRTTYDELKMVTETAGAHLHTGDVFLSYQVNELHAALKQLQQLATKHTCVVDNPPYMGSGAMNKALNDFVKLNYPKSKTDLMACFMEAGLNSLMPKGFLGMINQHSWMFLSSYEDLRKYLIENVQFDTLLHLGPRTFPEIGGEVVQNTSFTQINRKPENVSVYIRLVDEKSTEEKMNKTLEAIQDTNGDRFFIKDQKEFEMIPTWPLGFWASENDINIYKNLDKLSDYAEPRQGLATGDNDKYLRQVWEIEMDKFNNGLRSWVVCSKGGSFRRWYGNNDIVINWEKDGSSLKTFTDSKGKLRSVLRNQAYYFGKPGLTWSTISSSSASFRYFEKDWLFESKGSVCFPIGDTNINILSGYLNSKLVNRFLKILSPTLDFHEGPIGRIPYTTVDSPEIEALVIANTKCSKQEWNSRETAYEFLQNELVRLNGQDIEEAVDLYKAYWSKKFYELHANEEKINSEFISIYGLQEELTPDVPLEEITILREESYIENNQLVFNEEELVKQFLSYAVGCMFGRYSLDKKGLILANKSETLKDYLQKVYNSEKQPANAFLPDDDNIIPVLDGEWFADDIVGRFKEFLSFVWGKDNLQRNVAYIEEKLGKDLRKYFIRDFYNDHIKRYSKRPIYWMFSSPKGSFNVLIYMHRYTPNTLNEILNNYLREFKEKLEVRKEHLTHLLEVGSAREQTVAHKEIDQIEKMFIELNEYDRDILHPLATERISINLDDGVLVNYNKFGKAIKAVAGLNDDKIRKKVRTFSWINTEEIR